MEYWLFNLFSSIVLISGVMVVCSLNPVHSVLFLVLAFCNSTCLLLLLEVEFLGFLFLVVYVGAIAVLFLFVVMMLTPRVESSGSFMRGSAFIDFLPTGVLLAGVFLGEIYAMVSADFVGVCAPAAGHSLNYASWFQLSDGVGFSSSNVEVLGQVLYSYYLYFFLLAGFVLLIAMVGAIVLTLHRGSLGSQFKLKNQQVREQMSRDSGEAVFSLTLLS